MLFPAAKLMSNVIGVDMHLGILPPPAPAPVPGIYPYVGPVFLWLNPKFPACTVFVNGMPAAAVGSKGYSVHIPLPPHIAFPPKPPLWKFILQHAGTTVISMGLNANLSMAQSAVSGAMANQSAAEILQGVADAGSGAMTWQSWASALIPTILPMAEGNLAYGSSTVTVQGAPIGLVGPMFGNSCTDIPVLPNASVLDFSNVMVGVTLADLLQQFAMSAVQAGIGHLAGKAFPGDDSPNPSKRCGCDG